MKKLLLVFAVIISTALSSRADVAAIVASGATYDGTGTAAEFSTNTGSIEGVCSFTLSAYNSSNKDLRIYANTNLTITPAEDIIITGVNFTNTNSTTPTISLTSNEGDLSTTNKVTTWTGSTTSPIVISVSAQVRVKFIEITYTKDSSVVTKEPAGLAFTEEAYTANLGEDFTAPELTNPNGLAVSYKSSDETVATVEADGTVNILKAGTTTITATSEETEEFKAGKASYTLTVVDPNATEATFDFTKSGAYGFTVKSGSSYETTVKSVEEGIVKISFSGNYRQWNASGSYELRIHKGASMTFTVPTAYYITSIDFTGSALTKLTTSTTGCTYSNGTLTCTATNVNEIVVNDPSGNAGDTQRINTITVNYAEIPSGIADIEAEENGAVEYFNLQGVRVAEPAKGLYIRRAGNKVEKVIVR